MFFQHPKQSLPGANKRAVFLPLVQVPPDSCGAAISARQILPPRSGSSHPQDPFQTLPIIGPRPASPIPAIFWLGEKGFQRFPLRIRQVCRHPYQRSWLSQPRKFSDFFLWMIYETTSSNYASYPADRLLVRTSVRMTLSAPPNGLPLSGGRPSAADHPLQRLVRQPFGLKVLPMAILAVHLLPISGCDVVGRQPGMFQPQTAA